MDVKLVHFKSSWLLFFIIFTCYFYSADLYAEQEKTTIFSLQESNQKNYFPRKKARLLQQNYIEYFHLSINKVLNIDVSVHYQTRDGTAKAGVSYVKTSGIATIPAGKTSVDIGIDLLTIDNNKAFSLVVSNPKGAKFSDGVTEIVVSHTITTPPVITILGDNPVTVQQGSTYHDAGATAVDNVDGNVSVSTTSAVNMSVVGTYTVTYTASDHAGNTATSTRSVTVTDPPPVITILGDNPVTVQQGSTYNDAGATAVDNVDGSVPISTTSTVNTNVKGAYAVTYMTNDHAGNTATSTRSVIVTDTPSLVITILGDNPVTVQQGSTYHDAGATAVDNIDGNNVPVSTTSTVNMSVAGIYTVTYTASDHIGNMATSTRFVTVTDVPPVITIWGDNPVTVQQGSTYHDAGATAVDNIGANVPVSTTSAVNMTVAGTYTVTYTANDQAGNTATSTRSVIVTDTTPPVITILGDNPVMVQQGSTYHDTGATAVDNIDANVSVSTTSTVNMSIAGTYTVTYTASDHTGNTAISTRSVVVVFLPLNDTGITKCGDYAYDDSANHNNNLDCNGTDPDGDPIPSGQDALFGRDATHNDDSDGHAGFSFTKISNIGTELPASATQWSCVKDNLTGLIWEVKTTDGGLHDTNNAYTWYNPDNTINGGNAGAETADNDTDSFVTNTNNAGYCGYNDWRMPDRKELRSLVDYGIASPGPTIDTAYFPNANSWIVWSSLPHAVNSNIAWDINFYSGSIGTNNKNSSRQVRLVRSGQ